MKKYYETHIDGNYWILITKNKKTALACESAGYKKICYAQAWHNCECFFTGHENIVPLLAGNKHDFYKRLLPVAIKAAEKFLHQR
jgi:hypothetical protein